MNKAYLICIALIVIILGGCASGKKLAKDYPLFQKGLDSMGMANLKDLKIKKGDRLDISIFTETTVDQKQTFVFNMAGDGKGLSGEYKVNNNGFIQLARLGLIPVEGKTCMEVRDTIIKLIDPYIKDPGVKVSLAGINVNVFGEVKSPGTKTFSSERVTVLDVLGVSGGLLDDAKRYDVMLIREDSMGKRNHYRLDFRDAASIYNSPVYQVQQNDVLYFAPSDQKLTGIRNSAFAQKFQPIQLVAGLFSLAISIVSLTIALSR